MGPSVRLQSLRAEGKVALSRNASAPGGNKHDYSRSSLSHILFDSFNRVSQA